MRVRVPALASAVFLSAFFAVISMVSVRAEEPVGPLPRVWTDHIPVGRPYVKPPLPMRRLTETELAALRTPQAVPTIEPVTVDPVHAAILHEITQLKTQADDERYMELLDQLGSVYGGEMAGPFWISANGFTPSASQAVAEMRRADLYAIDPNLLSIPQLSVQDLSNLAMTELRMSLAVMSYAQEAYGGRLQPNDISLWLDHRVETPTAFELLPRVATAKDAGAELRKLHPTHPQFEALRDAYLVVTGKKAPEPVKGLPPIPEGPLLKVGDEHPHVAMVRDRLEVPSVDGKPNFLDRDLGNEIRDYLRQNGKPRRREINDDLRALLNAPPPPPAMPDLKAIQANMLRWRWVPRDIGTIHIWNNIPEFETRLVKNGQEIHRERIIVGQPDQQTPIFSDNMNHIVFKPQWGVPNSIKISDLLPKLRDGDTDVIDRRGMKIVKNGRTLDHHNMRWSSLDIRYLNIVQGPSEWNPLGQMKFMFPNRHSVYMHDTKDKQLFQSSDRAFSHGCIRVRNPRKLAEVIFTQVQGWDVNRINDYLGRRAEENNRVDFDKPIPVHNVYFTLVPDGKGGFRKLRDVYGHDRRVADAISGKSRRALANNDPARIHKRRIEEIERSTRYDNSSFTEGPARARHASDGEGGAGWTRKSNSYRAALGGPTTSRVIRQPSRGSPMVAQPWPPMFRFWGD